MTIADVLMFLTFGKGGGIEPTGTIKITENGNYDVTEYAKANVNVRSNTWELVDVDLVDYRSTATGVIAIPNYNPGSHNIMAWTNGNPGGHFALKVPVLHEWVDGTEYVRATQIYLTSDLSIGAVAGDVSKVNSRMGYIRGTGSINIGNA